jgi:hypothetical protein
MARYREPMTIGLSLDHIVTSDEDSSRRVDSSAIVKLNHNTRARCEVREANGYPFHPPVDHPSFTRNCSNSSAHLINNDAI